MTTPQPHESHRILQFAALRPVRPVAALARSLAALRRWIRGKWWVVGRCPRTSARVNGAHAFDPRRIVGWEAWNAHNGAGEWMPGIAPPCAHRLALAARIELQERM